MSSVCLKSGVNETLSDILCSLVIGIIVMLNRVKTWEAVEDNRPKWT